MSSADSVSSTWVSLDERERALLAPYAMASRDSAGRLHAEPAHPYRGPYQRDRDRIVHSAAFRRLSGKMQVFTGERGDYHRTRLTHTMEVASIARTIGRALRLNEDLIEALALMHDIGHPPFGHAGEDALDEVLSNEGGFSHNQYALTLVEELETPYHAHQGLNLTQEVLDGQRDRVDKAGRKQSPILEVQVVDAADSIAYDAHDVDDAIKLGLISMDDLADVELIRSALGSISKQTGAFEESEWRSTLVHRLLDKLVTSTVTHSQAQLSAQRWQSSADATHYAIVIHPEDALNRAKKELEKFLYQRVYRHPNLLEVRKNAQRQLRQMVERYCEEPSLMPDSFAQRSAEVGDRRAAAEYVAGMTDRFCRKRYQALFGS